MSNRKLRIGELGSLCLLAIASSGALSAAHAGQSAAFGDLKVGQLIAIKAKASDSGKIVATGVEIGKPYKLEGQIDAIDSRNYILTVAGMKIHSSRKARVQTDDKMPMEFSELRVGQTVKLNGNVGPDGLYSAEKIKLQAESYRFEGKIQAVDEMANSLTIHGVQTVGSMDTQVSDANGGPSDFSELRPGQLVKVKGSVRPDGAYQLNSVDLIQPGKKLKFEGTVKAIDDAKRTFTLTGVPVGVDDKTKIEFR